MTMLELIYFLETSQEETYSKGWYIGMIILIALLMIPWIYIIFRYGFFRRLRVRFIIDENEEYCIVEAGSTFGLAQYDHIALNADTVNDEDIVIHY